ncbi:MAG TPA: DUF3667 domain-containing protein [Longimicrobium sp.]|nr:DUF3667 domain-containing protein [Longimicrobium sp.]
MSAPALPAILPDAAAPAPAASSDACASCGAALLGDFCHACGERRVQPDELTLRAFAREVASEVGDLDSRTYRSLRLLITRPGFLTAEFVAGRRRAYLGPLKLFLAAFAAILVASSVVARRPADDAVARMNGSWMGGIVDAIAARQGVSSAQAVERLNATAVSHLSWLSLLVPLILAGAVALVFARRRHGYVEHLVFALHVATFSFVMGIFTLPMEPLAQRRPAIGIPLLAALSLGVMGFYLWRAVARVYGDDGWRGGWRAGVLLVGFSLAQSVAGGLAMVTATLALLYL